MSKYLAKSKIPLDSTSLEDEVTLSSFQSQIDKYKLLAKKYLGQQDYVNASALYNFALGVLKQVQGESKEGQDIEQGREEIEEIEEALSKIELEFLSIVAKKKISKEQEWSKELIKESRYRTKARQDQIKRIREKVKEEIDSCNIESKAPYQPEKEKDDDRGESKRSSSIVERSGLGPEVGDKAVVSSSSSSSSTTSAPSSSLLATTLDPASYRSKVKPIYQDCSNQIQEFVGEIINEAVDDFERMKVIIPYKCQYSFVLAPKSESTQR